MLLLKANSQVPRNMAQTFTKKTLSLLNRNRESAWSKPSKTTPSKWLRSSGTLRRIKTRPPPHNSSSRVQTPLNHSQASLPGVMIARHKWALRIVGLLAISQPDPIPSEQIIATSLEDHFSASLVVVSERWISFVGSVSLHMFKLGFFLTVKLLSKSNRQL